jgi:hypothetical protein
VCVKSTYFLFIDHTIGRYDCQNKIERGCPVYGYMSTTSIMSCYCSFCATKGINAPHDHYLRASKLPGAAITCPTLLATKCTHCSRSGHTARFCGEKLDQERLAREAMRARTAAKISKGEWHLTEGVSTRSLPKEMTKSIKIMSRFGALDIDDNEPTESTTQEVGESPFLMAAAADLAGGDGRSWASVVKTYRTSGIESVPSVEQIKWGEGFGGSWADED